jgi:signal transduction histidine kinase/DNA-binding response OmpR family regulator
MPPPFLTKTDDWLTRRFSYPGADKHVVAQQKMYWISSIAVTSMILLLTIIYHIFFPELRIIIYYGLFLSLVYMQGIIAPLLTRRVSVTWQLINQTVVALVTFCTILKLGGIPNSGGLVLVGLALVFFTLNYKEKRHSIFIYSVYIITVILAGLLHPKLSVPAEMTPRVNISLFVINILWITGFALIFVLNFISQRVRLEELENTRLREIDEARKKLYTNISHEFRTPLTVITGMNDLISSDPGQWLEKGSRTIDRNARILLNLVEQMLDLAKLEARAMPVNLIRADVILCIKHVVELFRSFAESKGIEMEFVSGHEELMLDYDQDAIIKIVSNLITNALKFTHPGGRVIIMVEQVADTRYEIRVSDNGPGITETFIPFVFDRFTREPVTASQKIPGSGLGLALTKELVSLLDGTIMVESIYGEGSEFVVELPVTRNSHIRDAADRCQFPGFRYHPESVPHKADAVNSSLPHWDERNPILLIVEDNEDVISYLMTVLSDDFEVTAASDGLEGFERACEIVPDIILTDVMMPGLDGIKMLDMLKNDPLTSHIPVVILTARADVASRVEGLARGADAYIAKPFNREELLAELRMLIRQRRLLYSRYSSAGTPPPDDNHIFKIEDSFIKKINEVMTGHLVEDSFDINSLCEHLNMSRTQLYRKFRSLTSQSPHDYYLKMKLHNAKQMLTTSDLTVAEAAYRAGFKNVSHFSKAFTREFGINPSDIRR